MNLSFCFFGLRAKNNQKYYNNIASASFWDNKPEQAIPQKAIYNIIDDYLASGILKDDKILGANGKTKKVAFIGFDGGRADGLLNIFLDKNNPSSNHYISEATAFSGIAKAKKDGGLYIAYCGGESGKSNQQSTSTSAGWTAELTGFWHDENGVKENSDVKKANRDTIMLKYAKLGVGASFAFYWKDYFDINLKEEVKYLVANPKTPLSYFIPNREFEKSAPKKMMAESLALHNEVFNPTAASLKNLQSDDAMRDYFINRLKTSEDTFVGGIFENCDGSGHSKGFGNASVDYVNVFRNSDNYAYQVMQEIENREKLFNEEWLVVITADHGGIKTGHGGQSAEERTIFLAVNRKVDSKYFGKNYDGYREN